MPRRDSPTKTRCRSFRKRRSRLPGDLWILGDHRLLVGDATNQDDVARLMAGDAADLVFTDPPYNVDYEGYTEERLKIKGDRMSDAEFKQFLEAAFRSLPEPW